MAEYKLKVTAEGDTEVVMPAGSDFVKTLYPEAKCRAILAAASSVEKSEQFDGFLCVNGGEIFIAGTLGKATTKAEKPADEAKAEPKAEKKATAKKSTAKKK